LSAAEAAGAQNATVATQAVTICTFFFFIVAV
jgi:hypothetical protein